MQKGKDKKPKRPVGEFSFCPKHNVFYKSCGCSYGKKKEQEQAEEDGDGTYVEDKQK